MAKTAKISRQNRANLPKHRGVIDFYPGPGVR